MPLKRYAVLGGRRGDVESVMKLTEAEAKRIGAKPVDEKAKSAPANKARTSANKGRSASNEQAAPAAEKTAAPAADKK